MQGQSWRERIDISMTYNLLIYTVRQKHATRLSFITLKACLEFFHCWSQQQHCNTKPSPNFPTRHTTLRNMNARMFFCVVFHCHWWWHRRVQVDAKRPDTLWSCREINGTYRRNVLLTQQLMRVIRLRSLVSYFAFCRIKHQHTGHERKLAFWNGIYRHIIIIIIAI